MYENRKPIATVTKLYDCPLLSISDKITTSLRKKERLELYQNKVLSRIRGHKGHEVRELEKLHKEELHNL